jgi:hypothetical protein
LKIGNLPKKICAHIPVSLTKVSLIFDYKGLAFEGEQEAVHP